MARRPYFDVRAADVIARGGHAHAESSRGFTTYEFLLLKLVPGVRRRRRLRFKRIVAIRGRGRARSV